MRGLTVAAFLAPFLVSGFVIPIDKADVSGSIQFLIPSTVDTHDFITLRIDIPRSGLECGSGELLINGNRAPIDSRAYELTQYKDKGLWSIETEWKLYCGPKVNHLVFWSGVINNKPIPRIGMSISYSQKPTSLTTTYHTFVEANARGSITLDPKDMVVNVEEEYPGPGTLKTQLAVAEKPHMEDTNAVLRIADCDTVKCAFKVAYHRTKEAGNYAKSKAKSMFRGKGCSKQHGKWYGIQRSKHHPAKPHRTAGKTSSVTVLHVDTSSEDRPHAVPTHGILGRVHSRYLNFGSYAIVFLVFIAIIHLIRRRRTRSACSDNSTPKKRRGCFRCRRSCCPKKRVYSEKDSPLPIHEPEPAYTMPSQIAGEISDLRSAAAVVDDIVSQTSGGRRYARRGSADTMETLPEYTPEYTLVARNPEGEQLPGYEDSEEAVGVADGYLPGTGEAWRPTVDGVDAKA